MKKCILDITQETNLIFAKDHFSKILPYRCKSIFYEKL